MAVAVTPSPIESKPARPWRDLGILAVAYSLLLVAAVLSPDAGFAPAAAFVLIIFLFRAAAAPRFGLLCTIVLTLLIPLTLAIPAGPVTLGIGRAVGFAFVAGWLASLSRPRAPLYRATPFDWAWLVLLLAILLSILSNSAQLSAAQFSQAARTFATFVVDYFLFFLAAVSIMGAGRRHFDRVLKTTATVVALISLIGIVEYVTRRNVFTYFGPVLPPGFRATLLAVAKSATRERGGLPRVLGTFEGPNRFGAAMAMGLPVLLHFWVTTKTAGRYLYALGAMACGVAALLAVSRSAFVATAIVLAVYFIGSGNFRLSVGKVGAVIAVFVIVLAVSPQQRKVFAFYFNDLTGKQQTIKGRTQDYSFVYEQVVLRPIAGSGPGTYGSIVVAEASTRGDIKNPASFAILDNSYLGFLTEEGLLGFLAFAAILWGGVAMGVKSLRRADSNEQRSLRAALLASTLVYALMAFFFDVISFQSVTKLYLVLLAASVVAAGRARPFGRPKWRTTPKGAVA